jgi:proteic killer suppression protein
MSRLDLSDRLLLELQGVFPSAASFVHLFAPVPAFSRELGYELRNSRTTSALLYTVSSACHCRARRWREAPVNGRRCVAERITSFRVPRVLALYNPRRLTLDVIDSSVAIHSFSDADTEELFRKGKNKRFAAIVRVATRKLTQLDASVTNDDMGSPPGNDLKFYDGFWHIRINDQWRLAWQWTGDGPENVKIYDPH